MKVSTDACILGSFTAQNFPKPAKRILDIGSGTGVLSLMLAQKHKSEIHAVEIEAQAFQQLQENLHQSPWATRLVGHFTSIQAFTKTTELHYDLIISNPPYYPKHLKSPNQKINQAKHTEQLSFEDLVFCVNQLLAEEGLFYLILPSAQHVSFEKIANRMGLYCQQTLSIQERRDSPVIRMVATYGKKQQKTSDQSFVIRGEKNEYSQQFAELLRDYYLIF